MKAMQKEQLQALISAWLDGRLSDEESGLLQKELANHAEARAEFRRWVALSAALREQSERPAVPAILEPKSSAVRLWLPLSLAAAAALLGLVFWPATPEPAEATSRGVAMVGQVVDAVFQDQPLRRGDTLAPGMIQLKEGLAQIEFYSGATAIIDGSTELEVLSAWEARCHRGRIRVHVPPAAKGFTLHTPDMKLEDLGTEFALNVQGQTSAVKVFEGEVIAHQADMPTSLTTGMTLGSSVGDFLPVSDLHELVKERQSRRMTEWQEWSQQTMRDPRLIAYYTFKRWSNPKWDRLVNNFTEPRRKERAGGAVGARWTQGRWQEKDALEFKRPGDRVRMNLDGTYQAVTMLCWVKVDSVDKKYNSLLLTDGYDNGEPHWQIYEDGSLMFSIMYRPELGTSTQEKRGPWNQLHFTKPLFTPDSLGRWHHLAVTYENQSGEVVQYLDGREASREVSPLHQPGRPITFGPCEIGNWGLPTENHAFPIRNLNGAIDEFAIYSAALSAEEMAMHYQQGKPE